MDDRIKEFKKKIAEIFNLGAVELKTDVKKIQVKGDKFTAQKNLFGDKKAKDFEKEAKVNALYDLADILATSKYDPSATTKEPSYANPNLKPKNKAHKDVKYWYKFRNEIVFDGVPYTVTFSIRDKGVEQYQYFIDFKENKTSGLSNTAVKNLLRADQMSYPNSISDKSNPVKNNISDNGADNSKSGSINSKYLNAVNNGDMETAQMLVDEAAKDAGYDLKLYHGTKDFGFTEFSTDKSADEFSIFTSESLETAEDYSKVKGVRQILDASDNKSGNYVLYGKSENLLEVDAKGAEWNHIPTPDVVNDVMFKMLGEMKTHDIAQYAKKNNYSGVKINNVKDGGTKASNVVVYFDSSSLKSADAITYDDNGNVIPLSQRFNPDDKDIRYSIPATSNPEELLEAYENGDISRQEYLDTIKKKKTLNPKEITDLTKEDANTTPKLKKKEGVSTGNKTSKFYGSVLASSIFDPKFKAEVVTDTFVEKYKSVTNKGTLQKAAQELDEGGEAYVRKWMNIKPERASLIDTAVGFILMDRYQRVGDYESAAAVTEKVREFGTAGGQQVQIFSIIGRLTPATMAIYAQRELDKAFEIFVKNKTQSWISKNKDKFKLTDDEIEGIRLRTLQAAMFEDNTRQKAIFLGEIAAILQSKIPPEKGDSMRAFQRNAMLLNPRTILRNIGGNFGMLPIYIASDLFGTIIDKQIFKTTGTRVKGVWMPSSVKEMKRGFYESYDDFKRGIRTKMEDLNRFDVTISKGKSFNENGSGFGEKEILKNQLNAVARALNKIDNFTSFCLEAGDRPFFEMWFMNSLNKSSACSHRF